jgi:3-deoxy-D-manno-octulosonic-acid transferase
VTGNVKFDTEIPVAAIDAGRDFRAQCEPGRPVWIAGSTHEGEEQAALDAHAIVRRRHPEAMLILVPRHPQRFEAVRSLLRKRGDPFMQRSSGERPGSGHSVFLLDTLGELQAFYAASDVAFVGGSLVPVGGHNLLEPAALALPMLSGPHTHNGQDIAELLQQCGALRIVRGTEELAQRVSAWFDEPAAAQAAGAQGQQAVAQSRGAVERLVAMVAPLVRSSDAPPAASSGT